MQTKLGSDFCYGIHSVSAILQTHPNLVRALHVLNIERNERLQGLIALAKSHNIPVQEVTRKDLDQLVSGPHQGVLAVCHHFPNYTEHDLSLLLSKDTKDLLVLVLDGVQDPHNLGACLRTANAFGVQAVIAPKDRAVGLTPAVRKVASGAAEATPFVSVTNLARTMEQLKSENIWLVGLDAQAEQSLLSLNVKGRTGIVMGAEGSGLRRLTKESCDFLANIPMQGSVASLNVSVACGIALYEVRR